MLPEYSYLGFRSCKTPLMTSEPKTLDSFDAAFKKVKDTFETETIDGKKRKHINKPLAGTVVIGREKGLNTVVLAVVAYMLFVGVDRFNIQTLSRNNLDDMVARLDYNKFEPYINYIMQTGEKKKSVADTKLYNDYIVTFVRYIYKLKQLGARVEND